MAAWVLNPLCFVASLLASLPQAGETVLCSLRSLLFFFFRLSFGGETRAKRAERGRLSLSSCGSRALTHLSSSGLAATLPAMSRPCHVVRVFTRGDEGGNHLGVINDVIGISDEGMQAVATELGFSETVFVDWTDATG